MEKTTTANITSNVADKEMTGKLTSPELRKRKEDVLASLKKTDNRKKELLDGYSYKFNGTDEMLDSITSFIKTERLCCDFFNFELSVTNDSFILLEISVAEGAKEFITTELEM